MQANTNEPQNIRMWGCKDASKHKWTLECEDARMCRCEQANMNPKVWGCEDAKILASTHEPEDMSMQGCEDLYMNLKIQENMEVRPEENTLENTFLGYIY